jgi:6-phosphogluconate dehydrogenase
MKIVMVGLGKMGQQLVEKLCADGHKVVAIDSDQAKQLEASKYGAMAVSTREEAISDFGQDKIIVWLMIPSIAVDDEMAVWQELLPADSIIIDGGNSDFRLTKQRNDALTANNIHLIDVGTSGGILGQKNGFCLMIGGEENVADELSPIFETLAKPNGSFHYFGLSGSGHFVKMVHNAIEYGYMESLAEGFELLADGPYKDLDLSAVSEVWQHGSIVESSLNGLAANIFSENPKLSGVEGVVAESGEARWSIDVAKEHGIKLPAIETALEVRLASQKGSTSFATKVLVELRNKFGGHTIDKV